MLIIGFYNLASMRKETQDRHKGVPKLADKIEADPVALHRTIADKDQELAKERRARRFAEEKAAVFERLYEEEKTRSTTDALTGIFNKRAIEDAFAEKFSKENGAIIFIDLDKFKPINDTFGHAAGDAALKMVARTLKNNVRDTDIVARVGGDEFVIILANKDEKQARTVARDLKGVFRDLTLPFVDEKGQHTIKVEASLGVETFQAGDDFTEKKAKADKKMYASKKAKGINR